MGGDELETVRCPTPGSRGAANRGLQEEAIAHCGTRDEERRSLACSHLYISLNGTSSRPRLDVTLLGMDSEVSRVTKFAAAYRDDVIAGI